MVNGFFPVIDKIATEITARDAANVDKVGEFPSATISALGKEGLLGLLTSKEVGGLGLGPRQAAQVVERLARECGARGSNISVSHVLQMMLPGAVLFRCQITDTFSHRFYEPP